MKLPLPMLGTIFSFGNTIPVGMSATILCCAVQCTAVAVWVTSSCVARAAKITTISSITSKSALNLFVASAYHIKLFVVPIFQSWCCLCYRSGGLAFFEQSYNWTSVGGCMVAFLVTLIASVILCEYIKHHEKSSDMA